MKSKVDKLLPYVRHKPDCKYRKETYPYTELGDFRISRGHACTCGLDELRNELAREKESK